MEKADTFSRRLRELGIRTGYDGFRGLTLLRIPELWQARTG